MYTYVYVIYRQANLKRDKPKEKRKKTKKIAGKTLLTRKRAGRKRGFISLERERYLKCSLSALRDRFFCDRIHGSPGNVTTSNAFASVYKTGRPHPIFTFLFRYRFLRSTIVIRPIARVRQPAAPRLIDVDFRYRLRCRVGGVARAQLRERRERNARVKPPITDNQFRRRHLRARERL